MTYVSRSSNFSSFIFCSDKHFSFIGKAKFRGATLSCNSSYVGFVMRLLFIMRLAPFLHDIAHIKHVKFLIFCTCSNVFQDIVEKANLIIREIENFRCTGITLLFLG